jgi:hypothetical protein
MKKLMLFVAALALPVAAHAAPCKDAKGKFIKCPPAAAAPAKPAAAAKPAAKPAAAPAAKAAKAPAAGKKAPCRDAKGRFAKCK